MKRWQAWGRRAVYACRAMLVLAVLSSIAVIVMAFVPGEADVKNILALCVSGLLIASLALSYAVQAIKDIVTAMLNPKKRADDDWSE